MTGADVFAENLLFATLDPTMREFSLPGYDKAILSDTVGFVSDLPTQLVAAFRATLEEVSAADVVVHVRDISHEASDAQAHDVRQILADLGVSAETGEGPPILEAWNKIDKISKDDHQFERISSPLPENVCTISAETGTGVQELIEMIATILSDGYKSEQVTVAVSDGKRVAWLHENGRVLSSEQDSDNLILAVEMSPRNWGRYHALH
ncbi:MAG: GTPase, partial [Sphingorhabdus sp.]